MLREMVREAERVIDHQVRVWEGLDAKAEQLMRLALLVLAGAVALATFFVQRPGVPFDAVFLAIFLGAGLLVVFAILYLLASYAGFRSDRRLSVGPAPAWLVDRSTRSDPSLRDHLRAVLETYRDEYEENRRRMDLAAESRMCGLALLVAGIGAYAAAFIYVVGGAIL